MTLSGGGAFDGQGADAWPCNKLPIIPIANFFQLKIPDDMQGVVEHLIQSITNNIKP